MLKKLSNKQSKILDWYKTFTSKYGYTPTYAEAGKSLWLTPWAVFFHVKNLQTMWYLNIWQVTKNIEVNTFTQKIPILWYVACWKPIDVEEEVIEFIEISNSILKKWSDYYGLIAKWDSMIEAWINDGDYLIIRPQLTIENGEIWVVIDKSDDFQEKATLKRVYQTPNALILRPANSKFPTTFLNNCEIRWKLVNVIKSY